ncbi:MAG: hypothetical protein PHG76_07635 [Eubacteriales bacterium]|nr:hypothetical protein [Eubacteriales bacterium]
MGNPERKPHYVRHCFASCLIVACAACLALTITFGSVAAAETRTWTLDLPPCQILSENGVDTVTFTGSEPYFAEEGRPLVPYLVYKTELNDGIRVQNVLLEDRSGQEQHDGLRLPVVILQEDPLRPVTMLPGWYPAQTHSWQVEQNADGSTTLIIRVFPFYTQPETLASLYYRRYVFAIESVHSAARMTRVSLDRALYATGDPVGIEVIVNNDDMAQDLLIHFTVRKLDSGAMVAELPPVYLDDVSGQAACQAVWTPPRTVAGDFQLEATVTDMGGTILDTRFLYVVIRLHEEIHAATPTTITPAPVPTQPILPAPEAHVRVPVAAWLGGAAGLAVLLVSVLLLLRRRRRYK